jgi:hexosaminidase
MLGSGPAPYDRLYTPAEIAELVDHASRVDVALVPEVDLPAHLHAALSALPHLRQHRGLRSVQGFADNVLAPGPDGFAFVDAVVDALLTLFPSSAEIHLGGDEVPDGGDASTEVLRRAVARVRAAGRSVGVWEEAARSGAVAPGDGYVVCWRTVRGARDLAAAGFDVVLAPGSAYYLDMAPEDAWAAPGASWAGTVTLDRVCDFEPGRGWTSEELAHLRGIQACLWTEHVHDRSALESFLLPRLDAFAVRAWTGQRPVLR